MNSTAEPTNWTGGLLLICFALFDIGFCAIWQTPSLQIHLLRSCLFAISADFAMSADDGFWLEAGFGASVVELKSLRRDDVRLVTVRETDSTFPAKSPTTNWTSILDEEVLGHQAIRS